MSATSHAHAVVGPPLPIRPDELKLRCIACRREVSATEKVAYWPPTKNRVGVIAHCRCLNEAGSL